jgi:predicted Zn-dependent protease
MLRRKRISSLARSGTLVLVLLSLVIAIGCASSGKRKSKSDEERPRRTVLMSTADDVRYGAEASKSVEAEMGLYDDPELTAYVAEIGRKLLWGLPVREFPYQFAIVDQMEPNAFALPGGYIYVSRGLLALVNDVDELACVLGHEIVHAARRHSAQQQIVAQNQRPLQLPRSRAATLAAYGRDMEREADSGGQRLCAAAGYDPMAMSRFLRSLDQRERLLLAQKRAPTFLDTHPGSRERAAANSARASELRWTRDPAIGNPRAVHLSKVDGMAIGDRPETGLFIDDLFVHPALDFEIRFPRGWLQQNSSQAVGAMAPRREAAVYLSADLPEGDLVEVADEFAAKADREYGMRLSEKKRVRVGEVDAVRYKFEGGGGLGGTSAYVTFFPYAGSTWRMVGLAPSSAASRYFGPILLSMRSFRSLSPEHLALIHADRLRVVLAHSGEDVVGLGERTGNILVPSSTALLNGLLGNERFNGGELMKIVREESVEGP